MTRRREFMQRLAGLPFFGGLFASGCAPVAETAAAPSYLQQLGVRPIINGAGVYTMFTGSLMHPDCVEAIRQLSTSFVRIDELHDRVGERIAKLLGSEAAMVSSGAYGAIQLGTAACIAGTDPDKIKRIPDLEGMKSEVVTQKAHWFPYNHAVRNCGVKLIEVDTRDEIEAAINEQTAMLLFLNKGENKGQVKMAEFVEIGRKYGVPTFNDAAADVPPVENLTKYLDMGFDLVAFSGGKGIRGPQSAGLLLGRKDLIEAARLNTLPHSDTMGRGLKVNKEEMVGMMVALEDYMSRDHAADWAEWESRVELMAAEIGKVEGVETERFVPEIANAVPHLRVKWNRSAVPIAPDEVKQQLRDGDPSIELIPGSYHEEAVEVASWMLQPGEAEIVAARLVEVLQQA